MPDPQAAEGPFEAHRRLLFKVAYDVLGTVADAEDVVQETWLRWRGVDPAVIENPRAYLIRIATNQALNRLRSVKARRETYIGPWLPEPIVALGPEGDPAEAVTEQAARDEAISMAMLVVLETLTPSERAVFVLREVFGLSHDEVAETLDRSPASVRQMAHRAREHVQARRPRFEAPNAERRRVTKQFLLACTTGDLAGLTDLLRADVTLLSDSGGRAKAARRAVHGQDKVGRLLLGITGEAVSEYDLRFALVNGEVGVVAYQDGAARYVLLLDVVDGQVGTVFILANPEKLARVGSPDPGAD